MYPAPEGRQVEVQPQQDALYGKRGKICLPRLRKHIVPHTLCRTPPRNDGQQYRGNAQQCQNHSLRVCGLGLESFNRFLQAVPNVGFGFLRSSLLQGCLYQQRNSLHRRHQHPHTAQAVYKDSRVAQGRGDFRHAGIEHKCHQCDKARRSDRHGFFCAFFPVQKPHIAEEIQHQQQNVHGDHAGWMGRSDLLAQQDHRRRQGRQKKSLPFPKSTFIRILFHPSHLARKLFSAFLMGPV